MFQFTYYEEVISAAFELIQKQFKKGFKDKNENSDAAIEKFIVNNLLKKIKDFTLISEESGIIRMGTGSKKTFFLDPIDGTGNFMRKIPIFAISFAYSPFQTSYIDMDRIVYSLIVSSLGLKFEAIKGKGFYINGQKVEEFGEEGKDIHECFIRANPTDVFFTKQVRLLGASSIELGLLANRTFDAFIDFGTLKLTDIAAPYLILKEAKVTFSDIKGNSMNLIEMKKSSNLSLVASHSKILHKQIVEKIRKIHK